MVVVVVLGFWVLGCWGVEGSEMMVDDVVMCWGWMGCVCGVGDWGWSYEGRGLRGLRGLKGRNLREGFEGEAEGRGCLVGDDKLGCSFMVDTRGVEEIGSKDIGREGSRGTG